MELSQCDVVTPTDQELSDQKWNERFLWYGGCMVGGGVALAAVIPGALGVVGGVGAFAVGEGVQFSAGALLGGLGKKAFGGESMWKKGMKGVIKSKRKIDGVWHYTVNWATKNTGKTKYVSKEHRYDALVLLNPKGSMENPVMTVEAVAAPVKAPPEPTPEPAPVKKAVKARSPNPGKYDANNHKIKALRLNNDVILFVESHFEGSMGIQYPGMSKPEWQDKRMVLWEWDQLKEQGYVQVPVQTNPQAYPKQKQTIQI